jgi:MIP family channel proteins
MINAPARLLAEFVGTFTLVLFGAGVVLSGGDLTGIALANGIAIIISVSAFAHVSGGAFNPAVTVALWATKRIKSLDALAYILTQLIGGLAAAFVLKISYGTFAQNVGVPILAQPIKPQFGFLIEFVTTFILMMVIMGVAIDSRGTFSSVAGIPIGLAVAGGILFAGPLTGGAMNPARWFGPAIASGQLTNFWIWIAGPILGALSAVFIYDAVVKPKK